MKKILIIAIGLMISSCSSKKISTREIKFYNQNNKEISERKFNRKSLGVNFAGVEGDFSNQRKLTKRENRGKVTNISFLVSLLEKNINQKIDKTRPLVLIYLQEKDSCISGINLRNEEKINWFARLEDGIKHTFKTKTIPVYVYRDNNDNLSNRKSSWFNDSDSLVEKLFFKQTYPCTRIVIVETDGSFVSYIPRIQQEYIWELLGKNKQ